MSAAPLVRYRTLLTLLLFEREAAGGDLPEAEEARFVALLDEVWWQLSRAEQESIDRELAQPVAVQVGEEHKLVDCVVQEGTSALPREAA